MLLLLLLFALILHFLVLCHVQEVQLRYLLLPILLLLNSAELVLLEVLHFLLYLGFRNMHLVFLELLQLVLVVHLVLKEVSSVEFAFSHYVLSPVVFG